MKKEVNPVNTNKELAKIAGVSHDTIYADALPQKTRFVFDEIIKNE